MLKWIALIAVVVIGGAVAIGLNMGEQSPFFVTGTIKIADELKSDAVGVETMFVIINDEANPMPMPFGAMKEKLPPDLSQPIVFSVTKEALRVMNPDAPPPKLMRVKVRIDRDGVAGPDQPGDLTGIMEHVPFGQKDLEIKIDHKAP